MAPSSGQLILTLAFQNMKASEYAAYVGKLSKNEKLYFYETLAHNLTVAPRSIWSNPKSNSDEVVEQLKELNEIQHRVTSKIKVERLELHEWPEDEFIGMIWHYVKLCPRIGDDVSYAIKSSYDTTVSMHKKS